MRKKTIKTIVYKKGDERQLIALLNKSKEPILIKMEKFTKKFDVQFFIDNHQSTTSFTTFENNICIEYGYAKFKDVMKRIKENQQVRIFGEIILGAVRNDVESHIPLWRAIPKRTRGFTDITKIFFFFGGAKTNTNIHYDREQCCNLHICLSGKKKFILFTEDQNYNIYKKPFISDSIVDFSYPMDVLTKEYPRIKNALGYEVFLECGDMLFMPRNCWHYTEYLEPSTSAAYAFYPKKIHHIIGYFTGLFYMGFSSQCCGFAEWKSYKKFAKRYAQSSGANRLLMKFIEIVIYPIVFSISAFSFYMRLKFKKQRYN